MIVGEPAKDHKLNPPPPPPPHCWLISPPSVLINDLTTGPLEVVITTL